MRTFGFLTYFIQGADVSPASGIKVFKVGSDDDATKRTAFGRIEDRRSLFYFQQGADVSPASGVKAAKFSSDDSGTEIGRIHADTWGNEIHNQKWQGAVS